MAPRRHRLPEGGPAPPPTAAGPWPRRPPDGRTGPPLWERLGETARAIAAFAQADRWREVARLEMPGPEGSQILLPHVHALVAEGDWEAAGRSSRYAWRTSAPGFPTSPGSSSRKNSAWSGKSIAF